MSRSQIASARPMATPSSSRSRSAIGTSSVRTGRSSLASANFANAISSFQRSSRRYDLIRRSPIGGA